MHIFKIDARSYGRTFEVFPEEPENVELMVEDAVSLVLADLFEEAIVDEVSVRLSPPSRTGHRDGSIHIQAQCALASFTLVPRTKEYIELAIQDGVCAILKELLGPVTIERLLVVPVVVESR